MKPMTKLGLDIAFSMGCANPKCKNPLCGDEMYFNQQCHPRAPTQTKYCMSTGVITVECMECEQTIVEIKVAE